MWYYHYSLTRVPKRKKTHIKFWPRKCCNKNSAKWECNSDNCLAVPTSVKHSFTLDQVILPLSLYLTEMQKYTHQKIGIKTCTAALLVITPNWKQLKKSSEVEWINSYKWTGCSKNKWTSTIPNTIRNLTDVMERKTYESAYLYKVQKWAKQKHSIRSKDSSYSWRSSGYN